MSGVAKNAVRFTLKDGLRDYTVAIWSGEPTCPVDITPARLLHIVSGVINTLGVTLSNLPTGSNLSLEVKQQTPSLKGKTKSSTGQKKRKKKLPPTGSVSSPTSKGAGKKAGSSMSVSGTK